MSNYKLKNALPITFFFLAMAAIFYFSDANATKPKPPKHPTQVQNQGQHQDQHQKQSQGQHQEAHGGFGEGGDAYSDIRVDTGAVDASSESVSTQSATQSLSVESNHEAGPEEVVLVPNNNTANCQRVYGFGGGNRSGNAVLGVPFRDKTCDLEAAADDAFAQGNITLGWVFKCKQKNLKKAFGGEQECLAAVANPSIVKQLRERVVVLEGQKETLLLERQYDQERCAEESKRAHESCVKK